MTGLSIRARLARLERTQAGRDRDRAGRAALDRLAADPASALTLAGITPDPWQAALCRTLPPWTLALCSRQVGKSQTAAGIACQTALTRAGSLTLLTAPTLRQSQETFRKCLTLYDRLSRPVRAVKRSATILELANGSRVIALPGDERTIRGFSDPDLVVVDEAARTKNELLTAVRPMLGVSRGRLLAVTTPFGQRGWFFNEWKNGADWHRVMIPATGCPRLTPAFLAAERKALGEVWFGQEYLCDFASAAGAVFGYDDVLAAGSDSAPDWVTAA